MWERPFSIDGVVLTAWFAVSFFRPVGTRLVIDTMYKLYPRNTERGATRCTSGDQDFFLRLYSGGNAEEWREATMSNAAELLQGPGFDPQRPSVFYFFGHNESPEKGSAVPIVSGYLWRGDHNVWLVDWRPLSSAPYGFSVVGVPTAAHGVACAIAYLGIPHHNIHFIGHSMGAQLAAAVGRLFQGRLHRITALDPALPLFNIMSLVPSINANDAQNVDVIHTDGGIYGIMKALGTVDFYPNGGHRLQPGCTRRLLYVNDLCSHSRSWELYAESLLRPEAFPAVRCSSWREFNRGGCNSTHTTYMGILATTGRNTRGSYFLNTGAASPYGLGEEGTYVP